MVDLTANCAQFVKVSDLKPEGDLFVGKRRGFPIGVKVIASEGGESTEAEIEPVNLQ